MIPMMVEQQPGDQVIGCQWVYAQKYGPDGEVVKLKSCVVAMGNQQTDSVDTHSPVATNSTFKSLLAIAAKKGYTVSTADVRSAYLHGECKEKVLMRQPPGYVKLAPNGRPYICRLIKYLYGLTCMALSRLVEVGIFCSHSGFLIMVSRSVQLILACLFTLVILVIFWLWDACYSRGYVFEISF